MPKKLEWEEIIKRSSDIHSNKYEYRFQIHKNGRDKISITCPTHGDFNQSIEAHLNGRGCPSCAGNTKYTKESLKIKLFSIYSDKYEYDLDGFKNNESIIRIKCDLHGWFKMKVANHLHGQKCKKCSHMVYSNDDFKEICDRLHNGYYDYSLVDYRSYKSVIKIICPKHGIFEQNARTHFRGHGCPLCKVSKAELKILSFFKSRNIDIERQKKFDGCFNKYKLPFDFYLTNQNICIEYDGYQHFHPVDFFGGEKNLIIQKKRDTIKDRFCDENNIRLFRIKYDEDIDKKLESILNEIQI